MVELGNLVFGVRNEKGYYDEFYVKMDEKNDLFKANFDIDPQGRN